ncbi:MAG TPA: endo alpha-1,4 polygalactosaminidase [Flavobacteriales bacterium]|nr:endo alpha-1,4 polygalactosaminidase [Flavobacteriales bacterium]
MQKFVIAISSYARSFNPNFIVIPQNGTELAFEHVDAGQNVNLDYLNAIDGFGNEEIFYNGSLAIDNYRLSMLQKLKADKPILVADYVDNNANIGDAISRNNAQGFICFPRNASNYDYMLIPDSCWYENTSNISALKDAQNYLYLISSTNFATKQDMINAINATNFDVVIIDLFFNDDEFTSAEIQSMKHKSNGGQRLLISYMSIGSAEKYRYYWKKRWGLRRPWWIKRKYDGYPDEFWIKYWKNKWEEIIYGNDDSYTKKIIDAGFDGVYLDNVEGYYFLYYRD